MKWSKLIGPSARIGAVVLAGLIVLYAIGRWDGRISQDEREHEQRYQAAMRSAAAYHAMADSMVEVQDSLRKVDEALALQEQQTSELLLQLAAVDKAEMDSLARTPVSDLLPQLRLRPIQRVGGDTVYATDADGVRYLAGRMLRLVQSERESATLRTLVDIRSDRITVLSRTVGTLQTRVDSAEARIKILEPLLEESNRLRKKKGKWFGFIPKPPPALTFLAGVTLGIVVTR